MRHPRRGRWSPPQPLLLAAVVMGLAATFLCLCLQPVQAQATAQPHVRVAVQRPAESRTHVEEEDGYESSEQDEGEEEEDVVLAQLDETEAETDAAVSSDSAAAAATAATTTTTDSTSSSSSSSSATLSSLDDAESHHRHRRPRHRHHHQRRHPHHRRRESSSSSPTTSSSDDAGRDMKFHTVRASVETTHAANERLTQAQTQGGQLHAQAQAEKGIVVVASSKKSGWTWTQHTTTMTKWAFGLIVGSSVIFGSLVGWLIQWATSKRSKATSEYGKAFIPKGDE